VLEILALCEIAVGNLIFAEYFSVEANFETDDGVIQQIPF
jgi:hypothetical protein